MDYIIIEPHLRESKLTIVMLHLSYYHQKQTAIVKRIYIGDVNRIFLIELQKVQRELDENSFKEDSVYEME